MMRIDFDTIRRTLQRPWGRRLGLAAGVVVAGGVGFLALESRSGSVPLPELAACCTGGASMGDSMMSPAVGGDKDFFEIPSSPPSAIFLLGNNDSMQDFVDFLPEVNGDAGAVPTPPGVDRSDEIGADGFAGLNVGLGCTDSGLVSAMSWFDKNSSDPLLNGSIPYDADADFSTTSPQFFNPNLFYQSRGRRVSMVVNESPASMHFDNRGTDGTGDALSACWSALNWKNEYYYKPAILNECVSCLSTKGWWRGPLVTHPTEWSPYGYNGPERAFDEPPLPREAYRKWVLSGRVLNVRPPKFVVARKVLKDVISGAPNVRMGVATFGPNNGWYDPPQFLEPLRPSCDQSFPVINEDQLDRPKLKAAVNQAIFRNNERSIGEALFGLGAYFSSQRQDDKWLNWFKQPLNPGWGWPGCCNGGTYDDTVYTGMTEGKFWATQSDEWVKGVQTWETPWDGRKSVCFSCQVNSVIVLADGAPLYDNSVPITKMMELLIAKGVKHPDGTPLTFNPVDPENNGNVGGVNYCDQFINPATGTKATKEDCDYNAWNWPTGLGKGNKNFMDDVAFFMANMDLRDDMPGTQSMRTYTIGYGDSSPMLQSIAMAGKGKFYTAKKPDELRTHITDALGDLKQLSTAFASANISSVQAGGMQSSVYVPRFIPRRGQPYEGHLYRFFYFSEFAQGCSDVQAKSTAGDPFDLNDDKDCDDTFFLDKPAGFSGGAPNIENFTSDNIVQENVDGTWVKVRTASVNSDGKLEGGTPAQPFWDFGETVGNRSAHESCNRNDPLNPTSGRCIFTLVDKNNDGKYTDADNPPVAFEVSNVDQLKKTLLSGGDSFCVTLFAKQNKGAWNGTEADQKYCATQLIRYVRGMNVFELKSNLTQIEVTETCLDGSGDTCKSFKTERPCADNPAKSCKLADIFHSTPVTVEPPAEPFLCSLGLSGQCVSTLYEDFSTSVTNDPLCATSGAKPCYRPTPMSPERSATVKYGAYDEFREKYAKRERIALVGSNGGMLHAIHVGTALNKEKTSALDDVYDIGTGQEMWAFIPPDLLPKLGLLVNGHEYFVDGTPMVRDIWADGLAGAKDGVKQTDEFRTLAVITERGGGQRYVGLDVTDPREMLKVDGKPFRWMFPNACDPVSSTMGQSWSNFAPKPAPIGPVRLEATSGPTPNTSRGWEERWVAVLNGGYSPDLSRGRGVYMVDAWSGETLWSAEAHPTNSGTTSAYQQVLNHMQPVVASASLVDIGKAENVQYDLDGFFDTMVVGDMGGQAWTFRFWEPGKVGGSGQVTNWFGSRSLEMARDDGSSNGPRNAYQKAPIFHVASNVLQPETGWLRSFVGTGDRQHMRTTPGADCGPDDLLACIRLKCDVRAEFSADINGRRRTSTLQYSGGQLVTNDEKWNGAVATTCGSSKMELTDLTISCPDSSIGSSTYAVTTKTESSCTKSSGMWTCTKANLNTSTHGDLKLAAADNALVVGNRYFGFHAYGGAARKFNSEATAVSFDSLRVTDTPGFDCGAGNVCSLVDVTVPDSAYQTYTDAKGDTHRYLPAAELLKSSTKRGLTEGPGWFVRYNGLQERTAAGSTVLAGVVFWPSFAPSAGVGAAACSLSGIGDMSYSWQADVITGLPDQSEGFRVTDDTGKLLGFMPNKGRGTSAPPTEAPPIISLSKSGGIRYEVAVTNPGDAPRTEKLRDQKNVTPDVYWLEVPRNLHECRHENSENCD
ncbi:hypothetical protein JRI60_42770 [Archangium violaceum]|uniref:hypothetical protein n=1 Tax=Archangium violaceum TaxID=83451 RepID=UPI0019512203|nr:hypothetical protein [Archangium violaceum]QRN95708.1 hypothetical protein JRI60_42770 [Archangium violaceum]